jgi:predicted MPP superfamily phosphohydrolase
MTQYTMDDLVKELGTTYEDKYNILITHNPKDFNIYADWGANLIFAGHTHGGMIRLFDRGIISTDRTLFPDFDGGTYFRNGNQREMIVSKGLSRGNKGFRLFNPPELIVVDFVELEVE